MNGYRTSRIAIFVSLGALLTFVAPAPAAPVDWSVRDVGSNGVPILSISDADRLLSGQIPSKSDVSASASVINFNEPDSPVGGRFPNDTAFPGIDVGHEKDFAAEITGKVNIPSAGKYTFGVSSDDGFSLKVGSFATSFPGVRSPGESYATFVFPNAGNYAVDLVYFQHTVNAELEFFASPGKFAAIGQKGSNFQLVGDSANGGLSLVPSGVGTPVPEPSGLLLLTPVALFLLLRRRRTVRAIAFAHGTFWSPPPVRRGRDRVGAFLPILA